MNRSQPSSDPLGTTPEIDGDLHHLGVVVRDIDAAMATSRTVLGVPSFHRIDTNYPARHRGWQGTIANRKAFGKWGDLIVELVHTPTAQRVTEMVDTMLSTR